MLLLFSIKIAERPPGKELFSRFTMSFVNFGRFMYSRT